MVMLPNFSFVDIPSTIYASSVVVVMLFFRTSDLILNVQAYVRSCWILGFCINVMKQGMDFQVFFQDWC